MCQNQLSIQRYPRFNKYCNRRAVAIGPDERVEDWGRTGLLEEHVVMMGPRMGCILIGPGAEDNIATISSLLALYHVGK